MAGRAVWNEASEHRYIQFWAPLKTHLNGELQDDIFRIFAESLYCDWIIKFGDITLKINRCILIARAYRFYNILVSLFQDGSNPTKLQFECVSKFLPKLYCDSDIEEEETAILEELESLKLNAKVSTPDSEGFITADSSPTDAKYVFYDAAENLEPLHLEITYLAKELEEQDHLSHLLQSISVKNKKCVSQKKSEKTKHARSSNTIKSTHTKNPVLKRLKLKNSSSDMDSGLETASSETSGMDLSEPLQSPFLEQLSTKERRIVNEHDSSSSDTTEDFEDIAKNVRNDIKNQTKEQKQKQNEEIVIMESSSVSSETGSWESVFPRSSPFAKQYSSCDSSSEIVSNKNSVGTSNGHSQNHYFIDASSLHDESEFCPIATALVSSASETCAKVNNKLTKVKVNELTEGQVYDVAEFQKEIKVSNNQQPSQIPSLIDCASTSSLITSTKPKETNQFELINQTTISSECMQPVDGPRANFILPKYEDYSDYCDSKTDKIKDTGNADKYSMSGSSQNDSGLLIDLTDNEGKDDDTQKPNFVRSNTFDLETDDDHVTLLRQNNERRQGSLIFLNSIQQYSTHSLGLDEIMPVTPHNSIIQLSDQRVIDPPVDCPLDSLFYEKTKPIAEEMESSPEDEENTVENLDIDEALLDLKPIKREESVPIISGGVSSQDFKQEIRIDSPLAKRKLESTPIVSGGMVIMDEPEEKIEKPIKPITTTATWVVDMKPEPEEMKKESLSSIESESTQSRSNHKSSLGFYVDFKDIVTEVKPEKPKRQISNESSSENGESGDKKNIFSMFIDFEAPKKSMPSRLSQSLYSKKPEKSDKPAASTSKVPDSMSQSSSNLIKEKSPNGINVDKDKSQIASEKSPDSKENGESSKSVYMFIESDTTVVRRKRSTSNNRSLNRHSWNSSGGDSDTSTLCHQRTYSLSGNEGSIDLGPRPIISENDTFIPPKDRKLIESSSSSDENKESSLTENEDQVGDLKKMEVITEVKETVSSGFVRLSDLDKPVPKITTTEPEQSIPARMTRSIPETSWIENKLLMSTSTGCRKSSSRLYPHLSTSTPSNLFLTHTRSKSPGQDTDEMVSELSDLSSMHSSTALEVSTEETSHSSSYQPHHATDRLGHDLLRMFLEEISPDVTVEVGGRRLKAHKCILSSRCQYFAAMLSGGWVESAGNVISLQGFSYQAVHFAMCHIYSGAADIPETISLVELATLADMLGLEGLKEVVAYTLKLKHCHLFHKPCSVCVVGVLECLPLAAAYGLDDLYRKALRWITRYFVRVWPTRAFAMLPKELMEKCYQQHVVHMSADNVLETTLCCDKLLVTLPTVRWAVIVHELTSQLADACQHYVTQHFSSVLASASFLSLGKELSWNISRLEDGLIRAAERLPPEQACRSYGRAHRLVALLESGEECWSPNFIELARKLLARVEDCVVRQAVRVSYTPAWPRLDSVLRARVQELCCLPLDRPRVPRQPRSTSGSRNLDLRQVRLAMQQHTRRAQSTDSRPATTRPAVKAAPKVIAEPPRPRTWPAQVNNKSKIISSSESSRTSSPAMKRNAKKTETAKPQMKKEPTDMSLDSLSSPVNTKARVAANNKSKSETKLTTDSLASSSLKADKKSKSKIEIKSRIRSTITQSKIKTASNILKSNIQKSTNINNEKAISKSLPTMNKENQSRPVPVPGRQQSKSGSSSSTQHSPSALLRNKQISTNSSSSPGSQPRTGMSPYNGSPSLRRSLLLAARSPQTPVKPVSPATNKRLARLAAGHSVTSPTKSSAAKCVNTNTVTRNKSVTQTHQHQQQQQRTTSSTGNLTAKHNTTTQRKQQNNKVQKVEKIGGKPVKATVERSGTFLKDEPTVLAKTESE